ncbi:hypothetical protein HRW23_33630 [Streptomyces lunaelactis]|uniref:hypothetical protein n=1 Tax=Streptomyces lunaelactis TaxID=1535768 RepID=UPI001584EE8E|nr:hypothetical protein [Streptomyces lunaelactis]NUK01031.1 hypothetical protein [Streptomyces lunaelactis]NUK08114.1 hypothetical protein [Streptomyces lunaelactis]NUK15011.1 hypothetical protein [Streptomyces lunaelactis]NUK52077.1 hypothetical protein [Streptomyces lunaelactis]NUK64257.1 hypothetical protein [Streptomyces lunaelactis]
MTQETLDLTRLQFALTADGHFLFVALALGLATVVATGTPGSAAPGPVAVLTTFALVALFAMHGLAFAVVRLTGAPFERARLLVGRTGPWQAARRGCGTPSGTT